MPKLQLGQTIINFPNNGTDALWSPAVIEFAEAVTDTLNGVIGPFDLGPTVQTLSQNVATVDLQDAKFNGALVRKFALSYAIYRTRLDNSFSISESGTLTGTFNTLTATWEIQDEYIGDRQPNGESYHKLTIGSEQVQLQTIDIGTPYDGINSKISFSAKTELTSNT